MNAVVVDASVALKWFLQEDGSQSAQALLSGKFRLIAPCLIYSEIGNALWKLNHRKLLTEQESLDIFDEFQTFPLIIYSSDILTRDAIGLGIIHGCTVYDSTYLALAIRENAKLATADERFVNSVKSGEYARYIRLMS